MQTSVFPSSQHWKSLLYFFFLYATQQYILLQSSVCSSFSPLAHVLEQYPLQLFFDWLLPGERKQESYISTD